MDALIEYALKFISSFIMMSVTIYIWYDFLDKKISYKDKKNIITVILLSIISIANYYIMNQYIRIACITMVLILFF